MVLELKLRKIGNSVGVVLPKEVLTQLNAREGDTVVVTETPDQGVRLTTHRADFKKKMKVVDDLCRRYQNTLRELSK